MTTVSDKLSLIYHTREQIKEAIKAKGGYVGDTTPFSEYPAAIHSLSVFDPSTPTYKYTPNPTWWDIKSIIENDVPPEGYKAVAIGLFYATTQTQTINSIFDYHRFSDGTDLAGSSGIHVWDTTKDKECDEGYKTRYIIYYVKNEGNSKLIWYGDLLTGDAYNSPYPNMDLRNCIGVVFNVPILIAPIAGNATYNTSFYTYKTATGGWNRNLGGVGLTYNYIEDSYCLEFVDVTTQGRLVVSYLFLGVAVSDNNIHLANLKYIAPLWELPTVFAEYVSGKVADEYNNYGYTTNGLANAEVSPSVLGVYGKGFPPNLHNIELHISNAYVGYLQDNTKDFPTGDTYSRKVYVPSICRTSYSKTAHGFGLYIYIEEDTRTLLYKSSSSYTPFKRVNKLAFKFKEDSNNGYSTSYSTATNPVNFTRFIIKDNTGVTPYLITPNSGFVLKSLPPSKINELLEHAFDLDGSTAPLYITSAMNDNLSTTLKAELANKGWSITVV